MERDAGAETTKDEPVLPPPSPESRRWPSMWYLVRATTVIALTLGVLSLAARAHDIILLIVLAAVIAIGLEPAVQLLMRLPHVGRGLAVLTVLLVVFIAIGLSIAFIGPVLVEQVENLAKSLPNIFNELENSGGFMGDIFGNADLEGALKSFLSDIPSHLAGSFGNVLSVAGEIGGVLFSVLSVTILTIYMMVSLPSLRSVLIRPFPLDHREEGARVVDRSIHKIGGYVSGMALISIISAVVTGIALTLLGVPYPIPLAIWAGIASIIPVIGAYVGGAPAVLLAFSHSPMRGLVVLAFFIIWQQVRDYVVSPPIMRDAVDLSPAVVVIATLLGGKVAGFYGVLLALPISATIKVALQEFWLRKDTEAAAAAGTADAVPEGPGGPPAPS